jgi:hypothetical protein
LICKNYLTKRNATSKLHIHNIFNIKLKKFNKNLNTVPIGLTTKWNQYRATTCYVYLEFCYTNSPPYQCLVHCVIGYVTPKAFSSLHPAFDVFFATLLTDPGCSCQSAELFSIHLESSYKKRDKI